MNNKTKKLTIEKRPLRIITDESDLRMVTGGSGMGTKPSWGQVPIWRKRF